MRILVVSDDDAERLRATSALHLDDDVEVVELTDTEQARALLLGDDHGVEVLVVDGDLSPRGGYALLYDLRAQAEQRGTDPLPSVALAAREQDRWIAAWAGVSDMLLKPVDPFEVARCVRAVADAGVPPYGDAGAAVAQLGPAGRPGPLPAGSA